MGPYRIYALLFNLKALEPSDLMRNTGTVPSLESSLLCLSNHKPSSIVFMISNAPLDLLEQTTAMVLDAG